MSREAMQQALEALEWNYNTDLDNIPACEQWVKMLNETITALRAALAEPEQEPVAYCTLEQLAALKLTVPSSDKIALYTAPTPRKPLSEDEIVRLMVGEDRARLLSVGEFAEGAIRELVESARAIERAHGIGEQHE